MNHRQIHRPPTQAENIAVITLTLTTAGMLFDLIVANELLLGGAIGCTVGFAIGWRFRHTGTRPGASARRTNTE